MNVFSSHTISAHVPCGMSACVSVCDSRCLSVSWSSNQATRAIQTSSCADAVSEALPGHRKGENKIIRVCITASSSLISFGFCSFFRSQSYRYIFYISMVHACS